MVRCSVCDARSRHNGPHTLKAATPSTWGQRSTGSCWVQRKGWGVGGRLTHLVHLAQLLLQVLLGHASQARVDHLNNLPERSRREKLRYGGERRAKIAREVCCARGRGAQTACAAAVGS